MPFRHLPWIVAVAALACSGGDEAEPDRPVAEPAPSAERESLRVEEPGDGLEISLVDSLPWENPLASGVNRRVVVRSVGGADTVPGVAVARKPVVVGDSVVTGFDRDGSSTERGFWYEEASGSVETVPLPGDFLDFTAHALAPDASSLAYVGQADDEVRLVAAIRAWPSGEPTWSSEPVEGYPSDATNTSVEWTSPDSVEIRIRLDALDTGRDLWFRAAGDPDATMRIDTLDVGPLGAE